MLSKSLEDKVKLVVETQFNQYVVWKAYETLDITWEVCIAKLSILHNRIADTPIEWFIEWITGNRTNFSQGSNGMKQVFMDVDNAWCLFRDYEGADIEEKLYDYISEQLNKTFKQGSWIAA